MSYLVGGDHFEPTEVLLLAQVAVHQGWQEHLRPLGRGLGLGDPADSFVHQLLAAEYLYGETGKRPAVESHYPFHPVQLEAGGEGLQELLRGVGLHLEVGQAAVGVLFQQVEALLEPYLHLVQGDPLQYRIQALQEGRDRLGARRVQGLTEV